MYKTVKHGENCLQYRILAQQEENLVNIKCRKSPRTITAKLITVIILLIIGIIASAVLVPLVLTNDFIALTGTFQKFSVSTLRRSHSGNHVVVIAKKPYGWSAPHSSVSTKLPDAPQVRLIDVKKTTAQIDSLSTASKLPGAIQTIKTTTMETPPTNITSDQPGRKGKTENRPTEPTAENKERELELTEIPSTVSPAIRQQKSFQRKIMKSIWISSTSVPARFKNDPKWDLESPRNFIDKLNQEVANPLPVLGSFLFLIIVIIIFIALKRTLPKKRILTEREAAESKEDKTRLLKPSGSSDHDEE